MDARDGRSALSLGPKYPAPRARALSMARPSRRPDLLDKELLDILACPACRADVRLEGDRIVCTSCGRRYPLRDGIPIMLVEEAETASGPER